MNIDKVIKVFQDDIEMLDALARAQKVANICGFIALDEKLTAMMEGLAEAIKERVANAVDNMI